MTASMLKVSYSNASMLQPHIEPGKMIKKRVMNHFVYKHLILDFKNYETTSSLIACNKINAVQTGANVRNN
jgi:hypothetical protein